MKIKNLGPATALNMKNGTIIPLPTHNVVTVPDNTFLDPSDKAQLLAKNVELTTDAGGAWSFPELQEPDTVMEPAYVVRNRLTGGSELLLGGGSKIGMIVAQPPSGDASGVTDRTSLQRAIDAAASSGICRVLVERGTYIVDTAVVMAADVHVEFQPGTIVRMRDSVTVTATLTSGNPVVPVSSVEGLVAGMYVGDETGSNLAAGTPFGAIPWGCKIASVGQNSVTLTTPPTGNGAVTLRIYPNDNCIRATEVDGWSLTCRGGWVTIDGNMAHAYPWPHLSLDNTRNAIRIVSCNNWLIDGVEGYNAFWHGLIAVGRMDGARVVRYRGRANGFRGIHCHAESVVGDATPEIKNFYFGDIEVEGNGIKSFRTRNYSEMNSGVFVVFENCRNIQVQSVRARNERGLAVHLSGAVGAFATAGDFSKYIQFDQIQTDNCGVGLGLLSGIRNVQLGAVTIRGSHALLSGCATLDAGNKTNYYVDDNGSVRSLMSRRIQLPAGSIAAHGIREGWWCYATDGTGFPDDGCQVWSATAGAGVGGTDLIEVFDPLNEANNPYTSVVGGIGLQVCASYLGAHLYTTLADGLIQDINIGSLHVDGVGRHGITSQYSATEYRVRRLSIGEMTLRYCGRWANYLASVDGLSIGKMHTENCSNQKVDNTAGAVSGGATNWLRNCVNFTIQNLSRHQSAGWADNNEALRCDDKCRNGHIWPVSLSKPVGAGMDVMSVLTPAGAGNNGNGFSGPIYIYNPRNSDGSLIGVSTTNTENQITRTNADACIRVVFADTP